MSNGFTILYAGGLSCGRQKPLLSFLEAVDSIKDQMLGVRIDVYGRFPKSIKKRYMHLFNVGIIKEFDRVSQDEIHRVMSESFVCLHLNSDMYPCPISMKIYEYAALNRPMLSINYGGPIDELIRKHRFGVSVHGDDVEGIKKELLKLYAIWEYNPYYKNYPVGIEKYHYSNIAGEFEKLFV